MSSLKSSPRRRSLKAGLQTLVLCLVLSHCHLVKSLSRQHCEVGIICFFYRGRRYSAQRSHRAMVRQSSSSPSRASWLCLPSPPVPAFAPCPPAPRPFASLSASIPKAVFKGGFLALGGWEVGGGRAGWPETCSSTKALNPPVKRMPNSENSCPLSARFCSLALS